MAEARKLTAERLGEIQIDVDRNFARWGGEQEVERRFRELLASHAALEAELAEAMREKDAWQAELEEKIGEAEEAAEQHREWPVWAKGILADLEKIGYQYDAGDDIDLRGDFADHVNEWVSGIERQWKARAEALEAELRTSETRRDAAEWAMKNTDATKRAEAAEAELAELRRPVEGDVLKAACERVHEWINWSGPRPSEPTQALNTVLDAITRLCRERDEARAEYAVICRAVGNWREWPGQAETDHEHADWKAAARALIERAAAETREAKLREVGGAVVKAWERLGKCQDEFSTPDGCNECDEYQAALDNAIVAARAALSQTEGRDG